MEETEHELHIAAEPEGLHVGVVVFQAASKVVIPIVAAVMLIFPIVNINVQSISELATVEAGSPVSQNAETEAAAKLNNYRVIDRDAGVFQIPVDRAIELLVNRESQTARVVSTVMPE